jgi:hypothetical protein
MTIELPQTWHDIEISKFPLIYDVVRDIDLNDNEKKIRVISILSDVNVNELKKIKIDSINQLIDHIQFIFKMEFPKEVESFEHEGYLWKINYDITELSAGDFITLSKLTENEDTIINSLPQIVALFVKPYKKKWLHYEQVEMEYKEIQKLISNMSVGIIYPVAVFFCSAISSLQADIEDYLEKQSKQVMKILQKELNSKSTMTIGVGM